MQNGAQDVKRPNHKRILLTGLAIGITIVVGWYLVGAAQCVSLGGDLQFSGFAPVCFQDFSGR